MRIMIQNVSDRLFQRATIRLRPGLLGFWNKIVCPPASLRVFKLLLRSPFRASPGPGHPPFFFCIFQNQNKAEALFKIVSPRHWQLEPHAGLKLTPYLALYGEQGVDSSVKPPAAH